mgnify:CR=1 FL=1|tara:strand:+ start:700 stop:1935 length:1236 start_codon:yes stop_codon:yes gene_type:complete
MFINTSNNLIFKEISISTIINIVIAGFIFFLNIKIANELGTNNFGQYHYLISIASIFTIFINFGTDRIASFNYLNLKNIQKVFNYVTSIRLVFFLLSLIITLIFFKSKLLILAIIALNLQCFNFGFVYEINVKNANFSIIFFIEKIFYLTLIIQSIFFNNISVEFILLSIIISSSISLSIQSYLNKDLIHSFKLNLLQVFDKSLFKNLNITLIFFSEYAYGGISKIFIQDKMDFESLGLFSAGMQLILIISIFQTQIVKVLRPIIFESQRTNKKEFINAIKKYFIFSSLPIILFSFIFYFISPYFIELLYDNQYLGIIDIVLELSIYAFLINIKSLVGILYIGFDKTFRFMIISVFFSIVLLLLFYFAPDGLSLNSYFFIILTVQIVNYVFLLIDSYFISIKKLNDADGVE